MKRKRLVVLSYNTAVCNKSQKHVKLNWILERGGGACDGVKFTSNSNPFFQVAKCCY